MSDKNSENATERICALASEIEEKILNRINDACGASTAESVKAATEWTEVYLAFQRAWYIAQKPVTTAVLAPVSLAS